MERRRRAGQYGKGKGKEKEERKRMSEEREGASSNPQNTTGSSL